MGVSDYTCPSGMILQVGTSSLPQVAAFEASSPPQRGETKGQSAAGKMLYNSKKNWKRCLLGSLEVLDNITIVPGLPKLPPSTPIQEVFFSPPFRPSQAGDLGVHLSTKVFARLYGVDTILEKPATPEAHTKTRK